MSKCDPASSQFSPTPLGPPLPVPGFGLPYAPPTPPFPDFKIPAGIPEDILTLINEIFARIPGGTLKPNADGAMRTVLDAVSKVLGQLSPFLALYNFFQAGLNLILCILDILCCLFNPWCAAKAIRKLFKRCLPDFLSLFPWLALVAMILALLLMLLALIEYIINLILQYIKDILANLDALSKALQFNNAKAAESIIRKLAYLLCLIEQIFAILIMFQAILAIIQALKNIASRSVCSKGSRRGDDGYCCTDDLCPPFVAYNPDGYVAGTTGRLIYYRECYAPVPPTIIETRQETWQLFDVNETIPYQFKDIIPAGADFIFWPESVEFNNQSSLKRVPYLVDMTVTVNPSYFGHTDPIDTLRPFRIKDCIVYRIPYIGYYNYDNSLNTSSHSGTFSLKGGKVFEADGVTPFLIGGDQATLENFIHFGADSGGTPSNDGYYINNIAYHWRINSEALVSYTLISLMCIPDLTAEAVITNTWAEPVNFDDIILPDIGKALSCTSGAMTDLRRSVSPETVAAFSATVTACLTNLKQQTAEAYKKTMIAGANRFSSTVTLDPDLQFVGSPIEVTVTLKDSAGTVISTNIPQDVQAAISEKLEGHVTLGTISAFEYDGYEVFNAQINSDTPGTGDLTVSFNSAFLSQVLNRESDTEPTAIEITTVQYQFVGGAVHGDGTPIDDRSKPRRDESDVSRSE